jgi:hypothetical protein
MPLPPWETEGTSGLVIFIGISGAALGIVYTDITREVLDIDRSVPVHQIVQLLCGVVVVHIIGEVLGPILVAHDVHGLIISCTLVPVHHIVLEACGVVGVHVHGVVVLQLGVLLVGEHVHGATVCGQHVDLLGVFMPWADVCRLLR